MFSPVNRSRVAKAFTAAPRVSTVMRAQRLGMGSATSYNTRVSGPRRQSRRQTRHPDRRTNSTLTCGPPVCQSPTLPPWPLAQRAHGGMGKSPLSCFTGRPSRFQMSDPQPRHTIISRSKGSSFGTGRGRQQDRRYPPDRPPVSHPRRRRVPRPAPKLGSFEIDHKSAA